MDDANLLQKSLKRKIPFQSHHLRQKFCKTRAEYRKGRKLTAVKAYSIADESNYLLIQNVPCLNGVNVEYELKLLCFKYGSLERFESVSVDNEEQFTQTFLVKFDLFTDAIKAKKRLDNYELLGSVLHVCYAPEFETIDDISRKIQSRHRYVQIKLAQFKNILNR